MRKKLLILHLSSLTLGGCIYLFFRADTLLMFHWAKNMQLTAALETIRTYTLPVKKELPGWVIFSLPDGLWNLSYVCLMFSVWEDDVNTKSIWWILLIPTIAILSELFQLINIVPGTFDLLDIIFYFFGFFLPFFLILKNNNSKNIQYEKNNF